MVRSWAVWIFRVNTVGAKCGPHQAKEYQQTYAKCTDSDLFRSSCACVKLHPGLCSTFKHSVVPNDSVSGQWRPWSDCANVQSDLGLRCPHMPADTFSHDSTSMKFGKTVQANQGMCILQFILHKPIYAKWALLSVSLEWFKSNIRGVW